MHTPYFPSLRPRLAPLKATLQSIRSQPLPQIQNLFASWIAPESLTQQEQGCHSRDCVFSLSVTFWAFLSQVLNPGSPCREAVRQVQALLCLRQRPPIDEQTSAYCQARQRLPIGRLHQIFGRIAQQARPRAGKRLWLGREVKVVDGSSVSLPDTPKNQKAYPQQKGQKPGCGFPIMKFVGLFSLQTGCLLSVVTGNFYQTELFLFRKIWHYLKPRDVLLADRHFSDYGTLAWLWKRGVYVIVRQHQSRPVDFRKGSYLGPNDRLVTWPKPIQRTRTLGQKIWDRLAEQITVRLIRVSIKVPGFRTRQILIATTLLDPKKYPAQAIAQLYLQRWQVELFFRHIKTTLQMEVLRSRNPQMVHRELLLHFIAYNLVRSIMLETARKNDVPLERISFKGSIDAIRQYSIAINCAPTKKAAARLIKDLLKVLALDLVPERPHRREPRALKRRPKPFSLLTKPRHLFKEIPHRGKYRKQT